MAILDQITQMKKNGLSSQEIISNLQSQGINPSTIMDAIDKSKIKDAVAGENMEAPEPFEQPAQTAGQENYVPQTQDMTYDTPQAPMTNQEYPPQESYEGNYESGSTDTGTMIEVAEQVFEEKTKKIIKQLESFKEFSTLAGAKITSFEERIQRMEKIIDNLQIKILEKIGSYGQGITSIKKEMTMMQDSFSKMIPGLVKKAPTKKKVIKKKISKK